MQTVIEFESDTPEQELSQGVEEKFDYSQVEGALRNNFTVAENVFARCAKHHFKARLGDRVHLSEPGAPVEAPVWAIHLSVSLHFDGKKLDTSRLQELVESAVTAICLIAGDRDILAVVALSTKISEISTGIFQFSLKQKWGLHGKQ